LVIARELDAPDAATTVIVAENCFRLLESRLGR